MDKKIFPELPYKGYNLYDAGGDISKKWFVYAANGQRKKIYKNLNSEKDLTRRYQLAKEIIDELAPPTASLSADKILLLNTIHTIADENKWAKKSWQTQFSRLKQFLNFKNVAVTPAYVADFFKHLGQTRSETTYAAYHQLLKQIFEAAKMDIDAYFSDVRRVRANTTAYLFFSRSEQETIKRALKNDTRLAIAVQCCYFCFIRPGSELTQIKVGDIYLSEQRILIRKEVAKGKRQEFAVIPDAFVETLRGFIANRRPDEYLINGRTKGKQIGLNTLSCRHQNMLKRLGIDTETKKMYSWKNTGAVHFLEAGGTVLELSRLMRHKDIKTTMGYIRDLGAEHLIAARSKFSEW